MSPTRKFQKDEIIDIAYKIVEKGGFDSVNARKIAKEMGGSVQPIYHNFSTMDELNKAVFEKIYLKYQDLMKQAVDIEHPYLAKGMAYIRFAREYPEFYKIIFMKESKMNLQEFIQSDIEITDNVIECITKKFDILKEDAIDFHVRVWIYTHGLACLVATKTINFSDEEIEKLLFSTVQDMFRGYKGGKK